MKPIPPLSAREALEAEGLREFGVVGKEALVAYSSGLDAALVESYGIARARACIVAAFPWPPVPADTPAAQEPLARVGAFAAENRYAMLVRALASAAKRLARAYRGHPGAAEAGQWRIAVNSRIPERPLAMLAGLGDMGKSGLFMSRAYGPACNLGVLFVPDAFPPECLGAMGAPAGYAPAPDGAKDPGETGIACGSCRICVDACPAGAIRSRGGIETEACIQYWASREGIVPEAVASAWGDQLYGCDVCTAVCPRAEASRGVRLAFESAPEETESRPGRFVPVRTVIESDDATLRAMFAGTAMGLRWMKPSMWRRNAALALVPWMRARPTGDPGAGPFLPILERMARDGEGGEAAAAGRALAAFRDRGV